MRQLHNHITLICLLGLLTASCDGNEDNDPANEGVATSSSTDAQTGATEPPATADTDTDSQAESTTQDDEPNPTASDTDPGSDTCAQECENRLTLIVPPRTAAMFSLTLVMPSQDKKPNVMTISCPGNDVQGASVFSVTCGQGQVTLTSSVPFPEGMEAGIDAEPLQFITPAWQNNSECGFECYRATVELQP